MNISRLRRRTLTERMVAKVSPKYKGYWERREHARRIGEEMRPVMEAFVRGMQALDERLAAKREMLLSPDANIKIGSNMKIRNPFFGYPPPTNVQITGIQD